LINNRENRKIIDKIKHIIMTDSIVGLT